MNVCILGAGAWGTAVATLLTHNNVNVNLWCYEEHVAHDIATKRYNETYLPGVYLDERITPCTQFQEALEDVSIIIEAVPVRFLRVTIKKAKPFIQSTIPWIILSKGIERSTLLLPSQIVQDELGNAIAQAVLVGPSYAKDLSQKQLTAVTLATHDHDLAVQLQKMFENDYFRLFFSQDIIGAQVGAAMKNVVALASGMLDGAGYQDNVKAFLLTKGLHEMGVLATALGGNSETLYRLCGVGDLVLTAFGTSSKNRALGEKIGQGIAKSNLLTNNENLPEGINTVRAVHDIQQHYQLDLPICMAVYMIIFNEQSSDILLQTLMSVE